MSTSALFRLTFVLLFFGLSVGLLSAQEDRVRQRQRNQSNDNQTEQPTERPTEEPATPQKVTVKGTLIDEATGEPIAGAYVKVEDELTGAVTDVNGYFEFKMDSRDSIPLRFSFVGYKPLAMVVDPTGFPITVKLGEDNLQLDEVVVSASRKPEKLLESPVTVERMTVETMQNMASINMFDAVANLKGVDQLAQSLTFKVFNTRGFNSRTNTRVVSRIDGMDMQAPGLNFPTNALTGPPSLDIASVELIPGAASALYGPNAMNGLMNTYTKDPFQYQGLSVAARVGMSHLGDEQTFGVTDYTNPYDNVQPMYEVNFRYAKAFGKRFAFKLTGTFMQGTDWAANDLNSEAFYQNSIYNGVINDSDPRFLNAEGSFYGPHNPGYDGINLYGDEIKLTVDSAFTADAFGLAFQDSATMIARDGYRETEVGNNQARIANGRLALHYRITDNVEAEISSIVGTGNGVYQAANRYQLNNFLYHLHKFELKGKNWFVRSYASFEDAGDSYDTRFAGVGVTRASKTDNQWFAQYLFAYGLDFNGIVNTNTLLNGFLADRGLDTIALGNHAAARAFANSNNQLLSEDVAPLIPLLQPGTSEDEQAAFLDVLTGGEARYLPGTSLFDNALDSVINVPMNEGGAGFVDKTWFQHNEAQYDFSPHLNGVVDLIAGASFRTFFPRSEGVIFADVNDVNELNIWEAGAYAQAKRRLIDDRLTLQASIRADKSKKTDVLWSPRASFVVNLGQKRNHFIRGSWQRAFRMPTLQAYYITYNAQVFTYLGADPIVDQLFGLNLEDGTPNAYTATSLDVYRETGNLNDLERADELVQIQPERLQTFEIGYRAGLFKRLTLDANYYFNIFSDYNENQLIIGPDTANLGNDNSLTLT
ncbi:MAG: TonB-dependent receptor, partial [Bacteroidota bacterium]